MSTDDFDLLDTSTEKIKASQVDFGDVVDKMKSQLMENDDPEMRQKILDATLDSVVGIAEEDRTSLLGAIKDLTDYLDEVGLKFESFTSLDAKEKGHIAKAQRRLEKAQQELEEKNKIKDNWWNRLWGRERKIQRAETELEEATKNRSLAENEAKEMFQQRIEKAGVEILLKELSHKSQAAVNQLKEREVEIKEIEGKLTAAIDEANKNHTKALQKRDEVDAQIEKATAEMQQRRAALEEVADKQSPEYSKALAAVTEIEQKVEELNGRKKAYTSLAASKDSFVHKHNLTIKVLTGLRSNLLTQRAKLQSDTEERIKYYEGYAVALKARTDQEFAAILETLGVKTDENVAKTLAAIYTASTKASQEMMESIPEHEKKMHEIYKSYAESLATARERDAEIQKNFENRYGIEAKEIFEEFYATKEGEAETEGADGGDGASDDLLG